MTGARSAIAFMAKARRALRGARVLLEQEDSEGACNRAYYAMFDAAHAALLTVESGSSDSSIKTHHGLITAFGQHLVLTGKLDAAFGRSLNQVQHLRQLADYTGDPISLENAGWAVTQAEAFVAAIERHIGKDIEP